MKSYSRRFLQREWMYSAKLVYRKWINFIFGLITSSDDVNLHLHNLLRFQATYFFRFLFETSCILEIIVIIRTCVSFYVKTGAYVGSLWSRRVDHSLKVFWVILCHFFYHPLCLAGVLHSHVNCVVYQCFRNESGQEPVTNGLLVTTGPPLNLAL